MWGAKGLHGLMLLQERWRCCEEVGHPADPHMQPSVLWGHSTGWCDESIPLLFYRNLAPSSSSLMTPHWLASSSKTDSQPIERKWTTWPYDAMRPSCSSTPTRPRTNSVVVEWVRSFKFHSLQDLTLSPKCSYLHKKLHQHLLFLRTEKEKKHLSSDILVNFYHSTLETITTAITVEGTTVGEENPSAHCWSVLCCFWGHLQEVQPQETK